MNDEQSGIDEFVADCNQAEEGSAGATIIEYCILAALIMLLCFAAVQFMGLKLSQQYSDIATSI